MPVTPAVGRLLGNALWLALGGVLAQVAFVSVEALVARRIGLEAYGTFAAVYAYALLMVHTLDMGMNWHMLQQGSRDPSTLADNLGTIVLAKVAFFVVAYPLVLGAMQLSGASPVLVGAFAVFAFFALSMMLQDVFATVFAARERMAVNAVFQAAVPVAMLVCVLLFVSSQPTLMRAAFACVLGTLLVTAAWAAVTVGTVRPAVSPRRIPTIVRQSFHYGVSVTVHALYFRLGVVTLTVLRGAVDVALFAAAYKLLELGFKIPTLATRVVAPKLFGDSVHRPEDYPRHAALVLRASAIASAFLGLGMFVSGPAVVTALFGAAFAPAGALVQVLAVSLSLKSVALLAQTILSTADEHLYRSRADLATTLVGAVLVVALTLAFGVTGTAVAVAAGDVIWAVLMVRRALRHLPAGTGAGIVLVPLLAAAVGAAVASASPVGPIVATAVALGVFGAVLLLSGHARPLLAIATRTLPGPAAGEGR